MYEGCTYTILSMFHLHKLLYILYVTQRASPYAPKPREHDVFVPSPFNNIYNIIRIIYMPSCWDEWWWWRRWWRRTACIRCGILTSNLSLWMREKVFPRFYYYFPSHLHPLPHSLYFPPNSPFLIPPRVCFKFTYIVVLLVLTYRYYIYHHYAAYNIYIYLYIRRRRQRITR